MLPYFDMKIYPNRMPGFVLCEQTATTKVWPYSRKIGLDHFSGNGRFNTKIDVVDLMDNYCLISAVDLMASTLLVIEAL